MNGLIILLPVIFPILIGLSILLFKNQNTKVFKCYVFGATLFTSFLIWYIILDDKVEVFKFLELTDKLYLSLSSDGLGKFFAGMIAFLWPFATLYAFGYMSHENHKRLFYSFYIITYGVTCGIAFSNNMLTLYFFYELLTFSTLPLVIHPMTKKAIRAGKKYLYLSIGGSAFAFFGLIYMILNGASLDFSFGGTLTGDPNNTLLIAYLFTFLGFGVKSAIFPLHIWLPAASVAPTPVTALLHAVAVVKAGVFAIIRLTYYSFSPETIAGTWVHYLGLGLSLFTIIYGSAISLKERHFKRRLAYSTVSNLSYIVFAIMLLTPHGLAAALVHMIFHAFTKITSFFCAGNVLHCSGREYLFQINGLGRKMPITFAAFTISALSLTGVPLFCGFISKFQICIASINTNTWYGFLGVIVLLISAFLTAMYMLSIVIRAYFLKFEDNDIEVKEAPIIMNISLILFSLLMIIFGSFQTPIISLTQKIVGIL